MNAPLAQQIDAQKRIAELEAALDEIIGEIKALHGSQGWTEEILREHITGEVGAPTWCGPRTHKALDIATEARYHPWSR